MTLDLFSDVTYVADIRPAEAVDGWSHWNGRLTGVEDSSVTLVERNGMVAGLISSPKGSYQLRPSADGLVVEQVGRFPDEGNDIIETPDSMPPAVEDEAPPTAQDSVAVIDVLVGYTPAAVTAVGGVSQVQSRAALAVATTNDAYKDSGIAAQLRLVRTWAAGVNADTTNSWLSALQKPSDGILDGVHAQRDSAKADLVAVLTGPSTSACGIAYLLNTASGNAAFGFALVDVNCSVSNLSFPHELGHNLAAQHDRYVATSSLYSYGFGYVNRPKLWRDILAYNNECADHGVNCPRIPRFANPEQFYQGDRIGIPVGQPGETDLERTINNIAPVVAGYRAGAVSGAPVANAGSDRTVTKNMVATLQGSASDPNGDPVSAYWTQLAGPPVVLSNRRVLRPTFTASPANSKFTFRLTVTDPSGLIGADTVVLTSTK